MSDSLKPLSAALENQLGALADRAKRAFQLTDLVRAALPEPEKNHVVSASYKEDCLVVAVDSAVWTARVRFLEESLRAKLVGAGENGFTKLKVRVGQLAP